MRGQLFRHALEQHTTPFRLVLEQHASPFYTSFEEPGGPGPAVQAKVKDKPESAADAAKEGSPEDPETSAKKAEEENQKKMAEASSKNEGKHPKTKKKPPPDPESILAKKIKKLSEEDQAEMIRQGKNPDGTTSPTGKRQYEKITDPLVRNQTVQYDKNKALVLPKMGGTTDKRCTPVRPNPAWNKNEIAEPLFNRPHLPICSRSVKGECPFYVDEKSHELRLKDDKEDEGEAPGEGEAPPNPEDAGSAEEALDMVNDSFGDGAWPFNQVLLAMMTPKPSSSSPRSCSRCTASAGNTRCSLRRQLRRSGLQSCGHTFL